MRPGVDWNSFSIFSGRFGQCTKRQCSGMGLAFVSPPDLVDGENWLIARIDGLTCCEGGLRVSLYRRLPPL
jgi:hypothetical protein